MSNQVPRVDKIVLLVRPIKDKTQAHEGDAVLVVFKDKSIPTTRYNIGKRAEEINIKEDYEREVTCGGLSDFYFHLWGFENSFDRMVDYSTPQQ